MSQWTIYRMKKDTIIYLLSQMLILKQCLVEKITDGIERILHKAQKSEP